MTRQAELLSKIDSLPPQYFGEVIDFVGYLQQKVKNDNADVKNKENTEPPLELLAAAATPHADRLLGAAANLGNITLDEIREERLAKHLV